MKQLKLGVAMFMVRTTIVRFMIRVRMDDCYPDGIAEERHQAAYLAADTAVYQRQDVRDHPYAEDEADCTQPHQ